MTVVVTKITKRITIRTIRLRDNLKNIGSLPASLILDPQTESSVSKLSVSFSKLTHLSHECIPNLKVPSTAMVNISVVPVTVKQNSDSDCASGGIETITVSEMKLLVLFSASDFMVDDRQL